MANIVGNTTGLKTAQKSRLERIARAKQTFEGFSEDHAKKMIGAVVAREIFYVVKEKREYDQRQFVAALYNLPKLLE